MESVLPWNLQRKARGGAAGKDELARLLASLPWLGESIVRGSMLLFACRAVMLSCKYPAQVCMQEASRTAAAPGMRASNGVPHLAFTEEGHCLSTLRKNEHLRDIGDAHARFSITTQHREEVQHDFTYCSGMCREAWFNMAGIHTTHTRARVH